MRSFTEDTKLNRKKIVKRKIQLNTGKFVGEKTPGKNTNPLEMHPKQQQNNSNKTQAD